CDEYWWPSGQAAGRVLKAHPELKAQSLQWKRQIVAGPTTVQLPKSDFTVAGGTDKNGRIIANTLQVIGKDAAFSWQVPDGKWVIYSYNIFYHPGYDGGKVNYLNPKLMDAFIYIAHKPYEDHFDGKMGKSIPGVFVDNEGDYGWKMAWSDYLAQRYRELKGRDIRVWMPLLTEKDDQGLWAKARYDWFDVVSDVYTRNFLGKVNDWLAQRNMYDISNLWEESLLLQSAAVGDFMRAQRTVSMPGNDCLQMKSQQVHDFKETQSVCEFDDKPFMSELMGVAGWEQTPAQMKMTLNAITAWGVTHGVPHGINLNRKLGTIPYPADWFTENPYWRYLHLWTDFARRAAFVNRQGKLVADILLLNPLESVWALSEEYFKSPDRGQWNAKAEQINSVYSEAMNTLTNAHLDYLIADRFYMKKAAIVKKQNPLLTIAKHDFSAIVMPPMFIVARNTAQKVLDFAKSGGTVVLLGELPKGSPEKGATDALIVKQMTELKMLPTVISLADQKDEMSSLPYVIVNNIEPQVQFLSGEAPLFMSHRKIGRADFYWIANNENVEQHCKLSFRDGQGRAEIWNCETGVVQPLSYEKGKTGNILDMHIKPYDGFWLVFNPDKKPLPAEKKSSRSISKEIELAGSWKMTFPETQRVPVSSAKVLFSIGRQIHPEYLNVDYNDDSWKWQNLVGDLKFFDDWRAFLLFNPEPFSKHFYRSTFELKSNPKAAFLNINADNSYKFWVNGKPMPQGKHADSWINVDLFDIGASLHKGENLIAIEETNDPGYGWFIAQGLVRMENGDSLEIVSNKKWKQKTSIVPGWENLDFDDSAWENAQIAPADISKREIRQMARPQRRAMQNNAVWWRIKVPPTAKELRLPGIAANAKIWVDDAEKTLTGEKLILPDKAKLVVVEVSNKAGGLNSAGEFICKGSAGAPLGSWVGMGLKRFSGFMDYEKDFDLPRKHAAVQLDLGKVQYMAEIWVNGKKAGERLWPPFTYDITKFVHTGSNSLRVRIGNLVVNEMGLKDDLGELRHWGWNGPPPDAVFDAGLFGPVKIVVKQ
ncbi:MAG: hypothetical protein GXO75_10470, partial [Calditrichaeota bacterium]|nr:hypothetical protein [Calditrichota bacterium]